MISMLPGGDKEVPFHHWKWDRSHHLLAACHSTFYSWARKQDERKHLYSSNNCSYWNCIINIYLGVFPDFLPITLPRVAWKASCEGKETFRSIIQWGARLHKEKKWTFFLLSLPCSLVSLWKCFEKFLHFRLDKLLVWKCMCVFYAENTCMSYMSYTCMHQGQD